MWWNHNWLLFSYLTMMLNLLQVGLQFPIRQLPPQKMTVPSTTSSNPAATKVPAFTVISKSPQGHKTIIIIKIGSLLQICYLTVLLQWCKCKVGSKSQFNHQLSLSWDCSSWKCNFEQWTIVRNVCVLCKVTGAFKTMNRLEGQHFFIMTSLRSLHSSLFQKKTFQNIIRSQVIFIMRKHFYYQNIRKKSHNLSFKYFWKRTQFNRIKNMKIRHLSQDHHVDLRTCTVS